MHFKRRETVSVSGVISKELYGAICREGMTTGLTVSRMIAQALEMYYKSGGVLAYTKLKVEEQAEGKPLRGDF